MEERDAGSLQDTLSSIWGPLSGLGAILPLSGLGEREWVHRPRGGRSLWVSGLPEGTQFVNKHHKTRAGAPVPGVPPLSP